jgi:hypothetical protein
MKILITPHLMEGATPSATVLDVLKKLRHEFRLVVLSSTTLRGFSSSSVNRESLEQDQGYLQRSGAPA